MRACGDPCSPGSGDGGPLRQHQGRAEAFPLRPRGRRCPPRLPQGRATAFPRWPRGHTTAFPAAALRTRSGGPRSSLLGRAVVSCGGVEIRQWRRQPRRHELSWITIPLT